MKYLILAFTLFLGLNTFAQVQEEIFESFKLQERRDVSYYIPVDYDEEEQHTLIVVLDGDYLFDAVVAKAKFYHRFNGMPPAIVVGINQSKNQLRYEDCAFDAENGLPTEKAKLFFEFLGMEIIPKLETTYTISPFKMIVGYDLTANFENYFLFKENPLFNSYISISPTLAPEMESRVPERINALDKEIFYHLITETEKSNSTQQITQLHTALAAIDKETFHYYYDEYETDHTSIAAYGLGKAFEDIFEIFKPISPKEYKQKIITSDEPVFDYLKNKYILIEETFGFTKKVDLNDIMAIYAASKKKEEPESLKELSDLCKKEFPETMLGFYFEGEYLEEIGEPKKALRTFEKAFGMAEIDFLTKDMALEKMDALKADFGY
ncbi:alpha/beta hydrolase-fold protein [Cellulophaga sp. F20128]|uniref:alpha/beta hydrolase n=1 Tax=Cellulophaga sp. F20128 TaxID=2926413 RepID=UPI001FF4D931|nr:alpha/beta hydrolase-fold protein [Cellulophaga sp. F20128]MCK0157407.1 alpha/beta hydrolase-fold protein [Cellulophaga sp. F20128]